MVGKIDDDGPTTNPSGDKRRRGIDQCHAIYRSSRDGSLRGRCEAAFECQLHVLDGIGDANEYAIANILLSGRVEQFRVGQPLLCRLGYACGVDNILGVVFIRRGRDFGKPWAFIEIDRNIGPSNQIKPPAPSVQRHGGRIAV